jgi:hypothetical protein
VAQLVAAAWEAAKRASDPISASGVYQHELLQAFNQSEVRAGYWDALVANEWNLIHCPAIEDGSRWWVVKVEATGEDHIVGRGKTPGEAMDAAMARPEWRQEG